LCRQVTDAAAGPEDEDPLVCTQLTVDEKALPRDEPGERKRSALDVAQYQRFRCEEGRRYRRVFRSDTVAIEPRQGEHVVADGEFAVFAGDLLDHAGELVRHDRR